jgi:dihydroorotate dehydrogenase electron transfer subunit
MSKIVVENLRVKSNRKLGSGYYLLKIAPFSRVRAISPGQFVHIKIPCNDIYFRRAFSVYDYNSDDKSLEILYKAVGRGTTRMAELRKGEEINILGPLGNSFRLPLTKTTSILIGGGIGLPPIYLLAKRMVEKGYNPARILLFYGGNMSGDLVNLSRVKKLGVELIRTTIDGSVGFKGLVTDAVRKRISANKGTYTLFACGPEGMLKTVDSMAVEFGIPGQVSLEAPMPCGVGICLGCILPLKSGGYTRVCRDGPVYSIGEVVL